MATARMTGMVAQWLERLLPHSLFGRLALLLGVTAVASHVLALTLLFETSPAFRPPPPPAMSAPWAASGGPGAMPPPPAGPARSHGAGGERRDQMRAPVFEIGH